MTEQDHDNPYETLGVPRSATAAEIRDAYHKLAWRYDPTIGTEPDEQRMKVINAAHDILCDKDRRRRYDINHGTNKAASEAHKRAEQTRKKRKPSADEVKAFGDQLRNQGRRGDRPPTTNGAPRQPPHQPSKPRSTQAGGRSQAGATTSSRPRQPQKPPPGWSRAASSSSPPRRSPTPGTITPASSPSAGICTWIVGAIGALAAGWFVLVAACVVIIGVFWLGIEILALILTGHVVT
jgi:curved DNA-binding protein CbpA